MLIGLVTNTSLTVDGQVVNATLSVAECRSLAELRMIAAPRSGRTSNIARIELLQPENIQADEAM